MEASIFILDFSSVFEANTAIFQCFSEFDHVKLKAPNLSIKAAEKRGVLNLSSSFHYNQITTLGKLFIEGKISLNDFLLHRTTNTRIIDATYFKRGIWQGTAGNLFLIKGEGYDDFIALFATTLKSKAETVIRKYNGRAQIEQTNKELKSY